MTFCIILIPMKHRQIYSETHVMSDMYHHTSISCVLLKFSMWCWFRGVFVVQIYVCEKCNINWLPSSNLSKIMPSEVRVQENKGSRENLIGNQHNRDSLPRVSHPKHTDYKAYQRQFLIHPKILNSIPVLALNRPTSMVISHHNRYGTKRNYQK